MISIVILILGIMICIIGIIKLETNKKDKKKVKIIKKYNKITKNSNKNIIFCNKKYINRSLGEFLLNDKYLIYNAKTTKKIYYLGEHFYIENQNDYGFIFKYNDNLINDNSLNRLNSLQNIYGFKDDNIKIKMQQKLENNKIVFAFEIINNSKPFEAYFEFFIYKQANSIKLKNKSYACCEWDNMNLSLKCTNLSNAQKNQTRQKDICSLKVKSNFILNGKTNFIIIAELQNKQNKKIDIKQIEQDKKLYIKQIEQNKKLLIDDRYLQNNKIRNNQFNFQSEEFERYINNYNKKIYAHLKIKEYKTLLNKYNIILKNKEKIIFYNINNEENVRKLKQFLFFYKLLISQNFEFLFIVKVSSQYFQSVNRLFQQVEKENYLLFEQASFPIIIEKYLNNIKSLNNKNTEFILDFQSRVIKHQLCEVRHNIKKGFTVNKIVTSENYICVNILGEINNIIKIKDHIRIDNDNQSLYIYSNAKMDVDIEYGTLNFSEIVDNLLIGIYSHTTDKNNLALDFALTKQEIDFAINFEQNFDASSFGYYDLELLHCWNLLYSDEIAFFDYSKFLKKNLSKKHSLILIYLQLKYCIMYGKRLIEFGQNFKNQLFEIVIQKAKSENMFEQINFISQILNKTKDKNFIIFLQKKKNFCYENIKKSLKNNNNIDFFNIFWKCEYLINEIYGIKIVNESFAICPNYNDNYHNYFDKIIQINYNNKKFEIKFDKNNNRDTLVNGIQFPTKKFVKL